MQLSLKKEAASKDHIYIATDPDREGEAIGYHIYEILDLDESKYDRVVFNEITKGSVVDSFDNARKNRSRFS